MADIGRLRIRSNYSSLTWNQLKITPTYSKYTVYSTNQWPYRRPDAILASSNALVNNTAILKPTATNHSCVWSVGEKHSTADCKKPRDAPATCALCNGPQTANYKGCEFYQHYCESKEMTLTDFTSTLPSKCHPFLPQLHPQHLL